MSIRIFISGCIGLWEGKFCVGTQQNRCVECYKICQVFRDAFEPLIERVHGTDLKQLIQSDCDTGNRLSDFRYHNRIIFAETCFSGC